MCMLVRWRGRTLVQAAPKYPERGRRVVNPALPLEAAMAVIFVSSNIWIELRFPLEPYYINCINLLSHVY
jgi:hypothetical protein